MLDTFSYGRVKRLNPESPAQLVNIDREEHRLGGAGNVAANVASLGGDVTLVARIGEDANGKIVAALCKEYGIRFESIVSKDVPTTTKSRIIETTYHQQLLRMDRETVSEITDGIAKKIFETVLGQLPSLIIVSDYRKGVVSESLVKALTATNVPIIADAKPGRIPFFKGALMIKPNYKEFFGQLGIPEENTDEAILAHGPALAKELDANLLITRSEKGASLVRKDGTVTHMPTEAREVFDVTGAGDTFIAAIAVAISEGRSLEEAAGFGNRASGIAVGKV